MSYISCPAAAGTRILLVAAGLCLCASVTLPRVAGQKKMKPEEVVLHHLDSIGSPEARAFRKSAVARGKCTLLVLVGKERVLPGDASFWSDGRCFRSSLRFPVSDYPAEDLSFDGKKSYVGLLNPNQRSRIGQFLYDHDTILKEGLLGGVLSTAWPLLEIKAQKLKLKYRGLRVYQDVQTHELSYQLRKGDYDVDVRLYFEAETFRHLGTTYMYTIPDSTGGMISPSSSPAARAADSSKQVSTRYTLEERFGDFHLVENLTIPFRWKVRLTTEGPAQGTLIFSSATRDLSILEWDIAVEMVRFNQAVDPQIFVLY